MPSKTMTFAMACNQETCSGRQCYQPVEVEVLVTIPQDKEQLDKEISIGYCLECAAKEDK